MQPSPLFPRARAVTRAALILVSLVAVAHCRRVDTGIRHPYAPDLIRPATTSARLETEGLASEAGPRLRRLAAVRTVAELGSAAGPLDSSLGRIEDVALDRDGRLFVLDSGFNTVKVYSPDGRFVAAVGRPGELTVIRPLSIAVDDDGTLYVGGTTRRLLIFKRIGGEYGPATSVQIPVAPRDMCWMNDELIVHGIDYTKNRILHRFGKAGDLRASFGSVYATRHLGIMSQIAVGRIECVESAQVIVFAPISVLGELRGYAPGGDLLWYDELHLLPMDVRELTGGGMAAAVPAAGYDRVEHLTLADGEAVLVQIRRHFPIAKTSVPEAREAPLRTLLVDVRTGQLIESTTAVPPVATGGHVSPQVVSVTGAQSPTIRIGTLPSE